MQNFSKLSATVHELSCWETKASNLSKTHETRDNIANSNSCSQVVLVYLYQFRWNSLLKCVLQPKIAEKSQKILFWEFKVVLSY